MTDIFLEMETTPLSAADQAAIDKRLTFMEVKDMAMCDWYPFLTY